MAKIKKKKGVLTQKIDARLVDSYRSFGWEVVPGSEIVKKKKTFVKVTRPANAAYATKQFKKDEKKYFKLNKKIYKNKRGFIGFLLKLVGVAGVVVGVALLLGLEQLASIKDMLNGIVADYGQYLPFATVLFLILPLRTGKPNFGRLKAKKAGKKKPEMDKLAKAGRKAVYLSKVGNLNKRERKLYDIEDVIVKAITKTRKETDEDDD